MTQVPQQMQVIEMSGAGGPEVLRTAAQPVPQPRPGEVLIKVAATGVNGPDMMQRKGLYPPPAGASPLLGLEVSGEIVALGDQVQRWKVGDKVCALTNGGGYSEYCVADALQCPADP
jgi:NADPH:quinone reductase-like Zn-dependent oxidoreductase